MTETIRRDLLEQAFGGNLRLISAFEDQSILVDRLDQTSQSTAAATVALQDATFVTLSANATLPNERVLIAGHGLDLVDEGSAVTLQIGTGGVVVTGDYPVTMYAEGVTDLVLPTSGTLATRGGAETLSNKTLAGVTASIRALSANGSFGSGDYCITVDASGAARTITLPAVAASAGRMFVLKKTDASANTVTLDASGAETIDGAAAYVLTAQYEAVTVIGGISEWHVI